MKTLKSHFNWLRIIILILIIVGIFFRFTNLNQKFYWYDEVFTSFRISGYTTAEFVSHVSDGRVMNLEELMKYQQPNSEKNVIDTVKSLATEEPQHPPLYFAIAHFWEQWVGHSIAVTRSLSAFFSLLILPSIYWLCIELFESSFVGEIAIAFTAVSPFHLVYAREAREYSLWMLVTILSSIALLRALRRQTRLSWIIYGATLIIGFYTYPFFALTLMGFGIYVIAIDEFQFTKKLTGYILTILAGLLAFIPWLWFFITRIPQAASGDIKTEWMFERLSLLSLSARWFGNVSRIFLDWGFISGDPLPPAILLIPLILFLVGYSLYFIYSHTAQPVRLFVLTTIGIPALLLISHDLILGGQLSLPPRYLIPSYLGIQLAIAYLFSAKITAISANSWRQKLWTIALVSLISCGVVSCALVWQGKVWWHHGPTARSNYHILDTIARTVNQAPQPLLVTDLVNDIPLGQILSISYLVDPKVKFQFGTERNIPIIPDGFSDVFLFWSSPQWNARLEKEQNYKISPMYMKPTDKDAVFWKATKE